MTFFFGFVALFEIEKVTFPNPFLNPKLQKKQNIYHKLDWFHMHIHHLDSGPWATSEGGLSSLRWATEMRWDLSLM